MHVELTEAYHSQSMRRRVMAWIDAPFDSMLCAHDFGDTRDGAYQALCLQLARRLMTATKTIARMEEASAVLAQKIYDLELAEQQRPKV